MLDRHVPLNMLTSSKPDFNRDEMPYCVTSSKSRGPRGFCANIESKPAGFEPESRYR